jgi:hypothetical protein
VQRARPEGPCIRSSDIRANIALGGSTGDTRLRLRNEEGANAVDLQASTSNVTNLFSNDQNKSNGLVKAWRGSTSMARLMPAGAAIGTRMRRDG